MPKTELLLICTRHCSYPMLRMDFGDGRPIVMPQVEVASPPVVSVRHFHQNHLFHQAIRLSQ